ncbi:hypothetical protein BH24DEI1_BH24DEI1_08400 [soil metagenome]|jgi:hypothetical protein|nr:hypothetical protein [Deinococcota bacterium]
MNESLRPTLDLIQRRALIAGGVGMLLALIGALFGLTPFLQSYLYAYFFWIGIALGSLAWLMIHHTVWGKWGFIARRILEAAAMVIPLMALLFLPILFGMPYLFPWANPVIAAGDALIQAKAAYLNVPFFAVRAVLYFVIWILLAFLLYHWSTRLDETGDMKYHRYAKVLAPPGIIFYFLAMTFAAFDWGMSLDPHWFSGIYGVIFIIGQGLSAMAFTVAVLVLLSRYKPLSEVIHPKQISDLGNFLLAFTMLWAYTSFSQFLIIWSANLGEDNIWYLVRMSGGWRILALFIVVFHFFVPFFILLSRRVKRNAHVLTTVALLIIFMRVVDLFWQLVPSFGRIGWQLSPLDPIMFIAIGGFWLAAFIWQLKSRALLPKYDPKIEAVAGVHHD